jgi:hypothetical protein
MNGLIKINITKSRAGHYTVTLRNERGYVIFRQNYIGNLIVARQIAAHAEQEYRSTP